MTLDELVDLQERQPLPAGATRFNPVRFVTGGRKKEPLKRLVAIAETSSDVFSVGTAVVDGVVLYHYATGFRSLL